MKYIKSITYSLLVGISGNVVLEAASSTTALNRLHRITGQIAPSVSLERAIVETDPLDLLLHNPASLALANDKIKIIPDNDDAIAKALNDPSAGADVWAFALDDFVKQMSMKIEEQRKKNPLWFFNECVADQCSLFRLHNPHRREAFEDQIALEIAEAPIKNYVAFASSGMITHIRPLIKALRSHTITTPFNIHLIDTGYNLYIKSLGVSGSIEIEHEKMGTFFANMPGYILKELAAWHKAKKEVSLTALSEAYKQHEMFNYCLIVLKQMHPRRQCRLFVHDSLDSYKAFCTLHPEQIASVIGAIDLGLGFSKADIDYLKLNDYVFAHNTMAVSIFMRACPAPFLRLQGPIQTVGLYRYSPHGIGKGFERVVLEEPKPLQEGADEMDQALYRMSKEGYEYEKIFFSNLAYNPADKMIKPPLKSV